MQTAIGYCRLSKEKDDSVGLNVQQDFVKAWAEREGYSFLPSGRNQDGTSRQDGMYLEDHTGVGMLERKILMGMLRSICPCIDTGYYKVPFHQGDIKPNALFVLRTDRLVRQTRHMPILRDFFHLHEVDLKLGNVPLTNEQLERADGKLLLNMLTAVDQHYRDFISDRDKEAFVRMTETDKKWWGSYPFGFVKLPNGKLTPTNAVTKKVIRLIRMGYPCYQIGNMGLGDSGTLYYEGKVRRLKKTLTKRADLIELPDDILKINQLPKSLRISQRLVPYQWDRS